MKRTDIINHLIEKNGYKNYLEIGIRNPRDNFDKIIIKSKDGVDPVWACEPLNGRMFEMESDYFFKFYTENIFYDIIFIDGLHLMEQSDKDIQNSLNVLSEGGVIVMHDCNPITEFRQREVYEVDGEFPPWNGTVYKSLIKLRCTRDDLDVKVVDTDEGCGIIKKGNQNIWDMNPMDECINYKYFDKHRKELLNLITIGEFLNAPNSNK